jgi:hypothetical protein
MTAKRKELILMTALRSRDDYINTYWASPLEAKAVEQTLRFSCAPHPEQVIC